jgi:hypothetical protein
MRQRTKLKRIEFSIIPEHEPESAFLMKRWGVNRSNTLRNIIYQAYRKAKAEDQEARRSRR